MTQNVFDAFYSKEEASVLKLKSTLTMMVVQNIRNSGWTQAQVAEMAGVTQPRVSNLMKGHIDKFSIDSLVDINLKLGATLYIDFQKSEGIKLEFNLPALPAV